MQLAQDELELFPERIPVVLQRCIAERVLRETTRRVTHLSTTLTVNDVKNMIVRERLRCSDEVDEIVILFGEQRVYRGDTPAKVVYDQCRDEDGFLYI